jgi:small-conductance mechanosensitive channel
MEFIKTYFSAETIHFLIYAGILSGTCFVVGSLLNFILYKVLSLYNKKRNDTFIAFYIKHTKNAVHLFTPFLLILIFSALLKHYQAFSLFHNLVYVLFYSSFAWLMIKVVYALADTILMRNNMNVKDNLSQRRLYTQITFLKRVIVIFVIVFFVSIILLNFEGIRKLGAGILTSAGVAGIIIGFAAQRSLSNLMAGLQIAFSQPIKIDDAVIVENEFGNVEEITLTYVIIKLWDMRRLVVPLNYFIERPFQNWTRTSAEIIGSVSLFVDYTLPVEIIRDEVTRLLNASSLWDGKTNGLQVVNTGERTMEIRALMSAANGGDVWNLRCYVREELIKFLRTHYPNALPRIRNEINNIPAG